MVRVLPMIPRYTPLRRSWLKRRPRRDPIPFEILRYWDWIRTQPCAICGTRRRIEAAHVGHRGLRQKCNGWEVIPLCALGHHREGPESQHKLQKRFWGFHGVDRGEIIGKYQRLYGLAFPESRAGVEGGAYDIRRVA
jgi:hypothetical protein